MSEEKERRIGKKSSAAAALLLVIAFAAACPAAVLFSDELSDAHIGSKAFLSAPSGIFPAVQTVPLTAEMSAGETTTAPATPCWSCLSAAGRQKSSI